jgi:hypothetical protein
MLWVGHKRWWVVVGTLNVAGDAKHEVVNSASYFPILNCAPLSSALDVNYFAGAASYSRYAVESP